MLHLAPLPFPITLKRHCQWPICYPCKFSVLGCHLSGPRALNLFRTTEIHFYNQFAHLGLQFPYANVCTTCFSLMITFLDGGEGRERWNSFLFTICECHCIQSNTHADAMLILMLPTPIVFVFLNIFYSSQITFTF